MPVKKSTTERLEGLSIPEPNTGCWLWMGTINKDGYGSFKLRRRSAQAHRVSFIESGRTIPEGLHLDHLCKVRCCINPRHLDPVTPKENVHRSDGICAVNLSKTHCPQGHPYVGDNLYIHPQNGDRLCRTCRNARSLAYNAKRARSKCH